MKTNSQDIIMDNKVFVWITLGTLILLLVPLILMTFKTPLLDPGGGYEVINWNLFDFIIMGLLIFTSSSVFIFAARKIDKRYRIALAVICLLGFLWLWAELAVGILTNWGN